MCITSDHSIGTFSMDRSRSHPQSTFSRTLFLKCDSAKTHRIQQSLFLNHYNNFLKLFFAFKSLLNINFTRNERGKQIIVTYSFSGKINTRQMRPGERKLFKEMQQISAHINDNVFSSRQLLNAKRLTVVFLLFCGRKSEAGFSLSRSVVAFSPPLCCWS